MSDDDIATSDGSVYLLINPDGYPIAGYLSYPDCQSALAQARRTGDYSTTSCRLHIDQDPDHVLVSRALLREAADVADLFNAGHDPNCGDLPARLREAAGEGEG